MATDTYPNWVPVDLISLLDHVDNLDRLGRSYPEEKFALARLLACDERMREVWEWHERIRDNQRPNDEWHSMDFVLLVREATTMPDKPDSLPPKQRAPYLKSVRRHAEALISLLGDTYYDRANAIFYTHPPDYLDRHLVATLRQVCAWTRDCEYREQEGMPPRSPIRRTGPGVRVVNFNCKLYEALARREIEIPFPILATVANVALELPENQQIDEDTARKQVRRHLDRVGDEQPIPPQEDSDTPF